MDKIANLLEDKAYGDKDTENMLKRMTLYKPRCVVSELRNDNIAENLAF